MNDQDYFAQQLDTQFAQVQNFSRIIVQPPEILRIPLDEYFRGQNLTYSLELKNDSHPDRPVIPLDRNVFSITQAIKMNHFIDFEQRSEEHSLPQTSIMVTDDYNNKYLIFIDFQMNLNIYNLSLHYITDVSSNQAIPRILRADLYNKDALISKQRQCNNLLQIDRGLLLANCKADIQTTGNRDISISVEINITDMTNVQTYYMLNGFSFDVMRDGQISLLNKINDTYLIIVKENTTNCNFLIIKYQRNKPFQQIQKVESFIDPNANLPDEHDSHDHHRKILTQSNWGCIQPSVIDYDAAKIEYLQIKDIKVLPHQPNNIVASDYNYGLLFWEIDCQVIKEQQNMDTCIVYSIFRLKIKELGSLAVLNQDNLRGEKIIFVQVINPPQLQEVTYQEGQDPYTVKIYKIPQDQDQYVSISLIDGNSDYILTHFVSIKSFKPVMRVYSRKNSFFSILHTQLEFNEFLDAGVFMSFINVNENFFLLKTSDYFKIYRLEKVQLTINAVKVDSPILKSYINWPMTLEIKAKNYTHSTLNTYVDILFIIRNQSASYAVYDGSKYHHGADHYTFRYSCGDPTVDFDIDQFFSGPINNLGMKLDQNNPMYFQIQSYTRRKIFQVIDFRILNCNFNTFLQFTENDMASNKRYLACIQFNTSKIYILDVYGGVQDENFNIFPIEQILKDEFVVPNARIYEIVPEDKSRSLIVVSANTAYGEDGAVIHFFKLFNVLTWQTSFNINEKYSDELKDFKFRSYDCIQFSNSIGSIIPEPIETKNSLIYKIIIFDLKGENYEEQFRLRFIIRIEIPKTTLNQTIVQQVKPYNNFTWILLSNNTFIVYQSYILNDKEVAKAFRIIILNETDPQLVNQDLQNFKIVENKIICFYKNRNVVIYQYDYSTLELEKIMILPLYIDTVNKIDYEFVINTLKKRVVFDVYQNYLFILYKKYQQNQFDGYTLFGYNIKDRRHNTVLVKYDLPGYIDNVDPTIVRLQVYQTEQKQVRVQIITEESKLTFVDLSLINKLVVNPNTLNQLKERCRDKQFFQLQYQIFSDDNVNEIINITIKVENMGYIIYNDLQNDTIGISLEKLSGETRLIPGKYQFLSHFHGYNIDYKINCVQNVEETDVNLCDNLKQRERQLTYSKQIEFQSSRNNLTGFFVIEPVLLFFDELQMRVYYPQIQQYESVYLHEIFEDTSYPFNFHMFQFQYNNAETKLMETFHYVVGMKSNYELCITKMISTEKADVNYINKDLYRNFNNQLYVMKVHNFLTLPAFISEIELYSQSKDVFTAIIALNSNYQNTQTLVYFYKIQIKEEANKSHIDYTAYEASLSATSLYLDNFKINAIGLYKDSPLIVLGIQNYGVMIYNVKKFQIVQVISIQNQLFERNFKVQNIIHHSLINIKLLIPQQGVITMLFDNVNQTNPPHFRTVYFGKTIELANKMHIAMGISGFSYLELTQEDLDYHSHIRFYGWETLNNTKSLGTIKVSTNEYCRYIQSPHYTFVRDYFNLTIDSDYQCVALICGSLLKIVAYNFYPSLTIDPEEDQSQEISTQLIQINATNDYSYYIFNLKILMMKQARAVGPQYYFAFILVLGLLLLMIFKQMKATLEQKIKKQESQIRKRSSQFMHLDSFDRDYSFKPMSINVSKRSQSAVESINYNRNSQQSDILRPMSQSIIEYDEPNRVITSIN